MPKARDERTANVHAWVTSLEGWTAKSLTRVATEANVAVTTLTNRKKDPNYPHMIKPDTITKIVLTHHVPPPVGFEYLGGRGPGMAEVEAVPFHYEQHGADFNAFLKAKLADRPGVDAWTLRTRALVGFGYLPGDVVILDLNTSWQPGDIVCAQLYSHEAGRTETIWRRYEPPSLLAAAYGPDFIRPIAVDAVAQKGVVVASFRETRR